MHPTLGYYTTTLNGTIDTMTKLDVVLVYGVGALVLIILPIIVISLYEMREVKRSQSSGMDALLGGLVKVFTYSLFFLIFSGLFLMLFVGMSTSSVNPSYGIYYFFTTDWLDISVMNSVPLIDDFSVDPNRLESAKSVVAMLALMRFVYVLLLMAFFLIMVSFGTSLVKSEHQKGNADDNTASYVLGLFVSTIFSTLIFWALLWMVSEMLNGIIVFSTDVMKNGKDIGGTHINIVNDVVSLFRIGADALASGLS